MLDIPPKLTQVKRSEINDVEQEIIDQFFYLRPVEVGGLLGTSLLPLNKPAIVRQESNVIKETSVPIRIDIKKDGLYDSGTQPIDYNLQRYEQRLLRQKHLPWFNRSNWELRLNSDVTTHLVSKPVDVSLESNNNAIATKMLSAVLSHRNNANKSKFYRLDLTIGTIAFHDHPLFCKEDYYAHQLMKQFRQYEERVDLNQVDHLNERLNFLQGELDVAHQEYETLSQYPSTTQQEKNKIIYERIKLLEHHISLTERLLNEERAAIDTMARNLYDLWGNIKNERVNNRFNSTSVKLQVREYMSDVMEYDFYLMQTEPSLQTHQGTPLPSAENRRRQNIAQTRIFVRILINDIYVARTRKVFLQWPKFEALFNQRFQLHVFTRPVKIRLEVCSGYRVATKLAVIEIEPPGLNVRALTSSAQIIRHQNFEAGPIQSFVPEQPRNLCGDVTFKAEWATRSYRVPPIRFEDIALLRNLSHLASIEVTDFNIDMNDPRNKELIEFLRKRRSKALEDLLARDSMFPHHKFSSLRELLMKFRFRNTELVNLPIPLLERDIINSSIFMDFIRSLQYITDDKSNRITLFYIQRYRRQYSPYSNCTIMMLELMNQVIERQNQIKLGVQTTLHSAKNIVSEVQLPDTSAFAQCMKLLFAPRRKLKPAKGQLEAVSAVNINKSRIHIIVYKGQNVPVRDEAFTIRYPQAERFYQAIPPAAPRQQPGMPMDPPFYGYQMSPRGTGGEFRPPSPGRGYPPDYYQRAQQPGELPPPPPVHGQGFEQKERVQSFIEVNLIHNGKSRTVRTAPFEGQSPEWNEKMEFIFESLDVKAFTKEELQDCRSILHFMLFDQILNVTKIIADKSEAHIRLERRYLGSFTLPMVTVFQNPQGVEASFRIDRPLCLFGYHTSKENPFIPYEQQQSHDPPALDPDIDTNITLRVQLDPVLELPTEAESDYYPGFENPKFLFDANQWITNRRHDKKLKNRNIKLYAENFQGKSVFLCRFITPIQPHPDIFSHQDPDPIARVARFVSLIPHIEDNQAFKDLPDMWCTCQELLWLGFGDFEEHAILLCNYFKYIDKDKEHIQNFLLLGHGVPEGNTVYVLRRDSLTNDVELWNASKGQGFSLKQEAYASNFLCIPVASGFRAINQSKDQIMSLKSVGCLIDENDVYVNIQEFSDPFLISYDIANEKCWKPFLGTGQRRNYYFPRNEVTSIQKRPGDTVAILEYEMTPHNFVQDIQIQIEDFIRGKFEQARDAFDKNLSLPTFWNHEVERRLYTVMPLFEIYKAQTRTGARNSSLYEGDQKAHYYKLNEIQEKIQMAVNIPGKQFYGFPLNRSLYDIESLWEDVRNSDIHNIAIADDNCKYVLCVYIAPYPNYICSVWIFVGAIIDDYYSQYSSNYYQ